MDRQKLDLLTAQANALGFTLCSIPDSNDNAKQRCLNFATEVRCFVKAWSNLSKALHDPQLEPKPAFTQIIDRILSDCSKIVTDLRNSLADVRTKQAKWDAAVKAKRWVPRNKTAHPLVNFLGRETTNLRQQQVCYAISVLDVLLGVVFHAKTLGEHTTTQDAQASLQDQLTRLRAESDARATVFEEERRIGDKYVVSSLWLNSVTWHSDSFDVPPFETLALQWFKIAPSDGFEERPGGSSVGTHRLTKIVIQLQQDLREQSHRHQQQIAEHKQQQEELRSWAKGTIGQLEFSQQKSAQESAAKIEEMRAQLEVQQQKIQSDSVTMEQLEHSRKEWASHYQKQSALLQQLEAQIRDLRKDNTVLKRSQAEQQEGLQALREKYEKLQQSHRRLQQQNQALRQRLGETEVENQELDEKYTRLKVKYAKAVEHNKGWKELYNSGPAVHQAEIDQLKDDIQNYKDEVATLNSKLIYVTNDRNQLRDSLKNAEGERNIEQIRASSMQERPAGQKTKCPNSYDNIYSARKSRSRSRNRSESTGSAGGSRAPSHEAGSRASSSTFVNDTASDHEHCMSSPPRRSIADNSSKIGSWFSPHRKLVISNH